MGLRKVEVMPAAVCSFPNGGYLGVRYGEPTKKAYTVERHQGVYTLYLPDRTLYHGRGNSNTLGTLIADDLDEILPMTPLNHPDLLYKAGYRYMMVGPERQRASTFVRRNGKVKVFSDSGGFQLASGVSAFIDPAELAEFYATRIDYGIGLDVPLPLPLHYTGWLTRMALTTAKNNAFLKKQLQGYPVEVYDVSHGLTLPARKTFLEVTMKNQTSDYLALGGIGQANYDTAVTSMTTAVLNICYTLSTARKSYKAFHILGTTSPTFLVIYNLLTMMGIVDRITADSSTYAQGTFSFATMLPEVLPTGALPLSYDLPKEPHGWKTPCGCPACRISSEAIAYRAFPFANMIHNLYVRAATARIAEHRARALLGGTLTTAKLATELTQNKVAISLTRELLNFVLDMGMGYEKAYAKHERKLSYGIRKRGNGMFEASTGRFEKMVKTTTAAIERYEEFHGIKKGKTRKSK